MTAKYYNHFKYNAVKLKGFIIRTLKLLHKQDTADKTKHTQTLLYTLIQTHRAFYSRLRKFCKAEPFHRVHIILFKSMLLYDPRCEIQR